MKEIPVMGGAIAIVDDSDHEALSRLRWYLHKQGNNTYAETPVIQPDGRRVPVAMHRMIMGQHPLRLQVDHKSGDGLDNRRSNLRWATRSQQQANRPVRRDSTSGFKGVLPSRHKNKWQVVIIKDRRRHSGGYFLKPEDAARKYDEMATELFGEFARLNFAQESTQ